MPAPLSTYTSYMVEVAPCAVCSQPCEKIKRVCLACAKFHERNKAKPMNQLKCQTGTNQCLLTDYSAVRISTGATWRLICRRCRLAKCLQVFANIDNNNNKEGSENSDCSNYGVSNPLNSTIRTDEHCKELENAVTEMMTMFEIVCMQWAANSNVVDLANMMSSTIILFSRHVPGFSDLAENVQLNLTFQAAPGISLFITLATKHEFSTITFLSCLFLELGSLKYSQFVSLKEEIENWNPSKAEISCFLAVILCRPFFDQAYSIDNENVVVSSIDSAIQQNVSEQRRNSFYRFLTIFLSTINCE